MDEQIIKEKEYLMTVFTDKLPNDNPFIIRIAEDKEMFIIYHNSEIYIAQFWI